MLYSISLQYTRQQGFDLPWQQWSLLNRFRTECTLQCLQKEIATYRHWSVSLWWDLDYVSHCRILSPDKIEWRLISATLCGWRRCFVADQLWFMTRIREEEESTVVSCFLVCSFDLRARQCRSTQLSAGDWREAGTRLELPYAFDILLAYLGEVLDLVSWTYCFWLPVLITVLHYL